MVNERLDLLDFEMACIFMFLPAILYVDCMRKELEWLWYRFTVVRLCSPTVPVMCSVLGRDNHTHFYHELLKKVESEVLSLLSKGQIHWAL